MPEYCINDCTVQYFVEQVRHNYEYDPTTTIPKWIEIILVDHILSIINYLPTKGPFTLWPLGRGDLGHFSLKKQDKSPLKYANCGVCISLEKKFVWLRRVWISIHVVDKLSSIGQTLGVETPKKWCHVNILKTIVYWLLAFGVKTQ